MKRSLVSLPLLLACGTSSSSGEGRDAGTPFDAGVSVEAGGGPPMVDGGYRGTDGGVIPANRFATQVMSFTPGDCAGFGIPNLPNVVLGPPVGDASGASGSTDVVSLGVGGTIVLGFGDDAIQDGAGADFIVFENPFFIAGTQKTNAELGEVSVSEDGTTWKTFTCTPDPDAGASTYVGCAGWHPVFSAPGNGISPLDPRTAGGDAFDLADVGMPSAKFVRIRDLSSATSCPSQPPKPTTVGFDLDAISVVHGL